MEPHAHRDTVRRLADDLGWLEEHCRRRPELAAHATHLRLASALARNVIGPAADGQPPKPLFVAVVGGAGAGKSTVVNFLCGSVVADANPQAGFTRHPTAFLPASLTAPWPSQLGFLGPLHRLADDRPADLDEDVYQVRRFAETRKPDVGSANGVGSSVPTSDISLPTSDFVIWDCPDMTTWASAGYVARLMEVVALADVVVYVASDERYNDEVPTQFLHLVIKAGKPVVCCLTKMREADAAPLSEHFRKQVLERLPPSDGDLPNVPVVCIPNIPADVRNDPGGWGVKYRVPLLNHLLSVAPSPEVARRRTVANAVKYLESAGEGLVEVARRDLSELDSWREVVAAGRAEFERRYRSEYLAGEAFARFDRTREQVAEMLDLPGPAKAVSGVFALARWPLKAAGDFLRKTVVRPAPPNLGERAVCDAAFAAWVDRLRAEGLRRSASHPLWKQMTHAFDAGLATAAEEQYRERARALEREETGELDAMARAVPEKLATRPGLLATLRVSVIALDAAMILAVVLQVVWAGWSPWCLLLILPLLSLDRLVVEFAVKRVVDAGRNRLRAHREALLAEQLTAPLAAWFDERPAAVGTPLEKLQLALTRVPEAIKELAGVTAR